MGLFDNINSGYDATGIPLGYRVAMLGQILQQASGGRGGGGYGSGAMAALMKDARDRALEERNRQQAIDYASKVDNPELMYLVKNRLIDPSELVKRVLDQETVSQQHAWDTQKTQQEHAYTEGTVWPHEQSVKEEQRTYDNVKAAFDKQHKIDDWQHGMAQGSPVSPQDLAQGPGSEIGRTPKVLLPGATGVMPNADVSEQLRRMRVLTGIPDLTPEESKAVIAAGPELGPTAITNIQASRKAAQEQIDKSITPEKRLYDEAVAQGYKGTITDFIMMTKKAGATNVNIDSAIGEDGKVFGKPEPGTMIVKDETQPGGYRVIPMTGSEQAQKVADKQAAAASAANVAQTRAASALTAIGNIRRIQDQSTLPVVGRFTENPMYTAVNPLAQSVKNELGTLHSAISMQNLSDIRNNSPTGGGLGSITEMEEKLMSYYYGNTEQSTDEGTFNSNLDQVNDRFRQFLRRNATASSLYAEALKSGDYSKYQQWTAGEEAKLAKELNDKLGPDSIDTLTDAPRIKSLISGKPEEPPPGAPPSGTGGSSPSSPGPQGAAPSPATPRGGPPAAPSGVASGLTTAPDDAALYKETSDTLPPGFTIQPATGRGNRPTVLDPEGKAVGTIEPDGRIRKQVFKGYSQDELDMMEAVSGERKPGQKTRREILDEQKNMSWPSWIGQTADDAARVGARGATFGGLDWLLGPDDKSKTREAAIRLGTPGAALEAAGNLTSPVARPLSVAGDFAPVVKQALEKAPWLLKWLGHGAEGAGVAGTNATFNEGDPRVSAALGGALGLAGGAMGPLLQAVFKGAMGLPSNVGSKAIGNAFKIGSTPVTDLPGALERQTFKDAMNAQPTETFTKQYQQDFGKLSKKFIPGGNAILPQSTVKQVTSDLKVRPTTTAQSDTEVKQMLKIMANPKGKGQNTIQDWDKKYRDLERFEGSDDPYVAANAKKLRDAIRTNLNKVDPNYETMVQNREAAVRGGKAGARLSSPDPNSRHTDSLLLGSALLSPIILGTSALTVPRIAGNLAYRAGKLSQGMPSWGGLGGIIEKLLESGGQQQP